MAARSILRAFVLRGQGANGRLFAMAVASALVLVAATATSADQPGLAPTADDMAVASSPDAALKAIAAQDARAAAVAYRLAVANVDLCTDKGPQLGLVIHDVLQYSPRLRPALLDEHHMDDRPAVASVVPGGPADRAGLVADDTFVEVGGQPVARAKDLRRQAFESARQTYQPVEALSSMLRSALEAGPARVKVRRGDSIVTVVLNSDLGCAFDTQVVPSNALTARADGHHIFISTQLVEFATADADLALILGHELAHNLLHHRERLDEHGFARQWLGNFATNPLALKRAEIAADYVGLYLTYRAGFDISDGGAFWRRWASHHWDAWLPPLDHPAAAARARALDSARDEIFRKAKAGLPIIPNGFGEARTGRL